MKKYFLVLFILITGCQQTPNNKTQVYYSSPEMVGSLSYDNQPVINARIYLLTSCDDKSTATDLSGYFALSPSCMDVIKHVPADELGFFYQLVVDVGTEQLLWQISGLGYGFKYIKANIDLATNMVVYQVSDDINPPYEKVDGLVLFNQ
ncbi:hypothetical protein [Entomomonas asaccharolytica]|uniref:Uncharacterized protein n=1 Tax=Entomomonas asaccharolytica TaxID=2785331 RepID=A0A974NCS9_9GAMM|nr:hypothetical protein [Entomomonas asaccharolytica]QQP84316.1 hypothetical protein JHT90_07705 [Entomomonas asaccharolytica]